MNTYTISEYNQQYFNKKTENYVKKIYSLEATTRFVFFCFSILKEHMESSLKCSVYTYNVSEFNQYLKKTEIMLKKNIF